MTQPTAVKPSPIDYEPLISLKNAAVSLGLPYFKIQRAARDGLIPTYFVYNSRRLVRLSEVVAVINGTRTGGTNV